MPFALLSSVPAPDTPHDYSISLLHINSPVLESLNIQQCHEYQEKKNFILCIGTLCVTLSKDLPLNKLFLECGVSLNLFLELSQSETILPLLKINDNVQSAYVGVKEITPQLDMDVCALLSKKKYIRLMVSPISQDAPVINKLILKVWAMESLCTVTSPSEVVKFTNVIHSVNGLVKSLQPQLNIFQISNIGEYTIIHCIPFSVLKLA